MLLLILWMALFKDLHPMMLVNTMRRALAIWKLCHMEITYSNCDVGPTDHLSFFLQVNETT